MTRARSPDEPTFEEVLDALLAAGEMGAAVLVEGEKDETALRALGFEGLILRLHTGERIINRFQRIAHEREARRSRASTPIAPLILLVDWDRKGGHLAQLSRDAARANGVTLDETHRKALSRATRGEIRTVESLLSYHLRMERERVKGE